MCEDGSVTDCLEEREGRVIPMMKEMKAVESAIGEWTHVGLRGDSFDYAISELLQAQLKLARLKAEAAAQCGNTPALLDAIEDLEKTGKRISPKKVWMLPIRLHDLCWIDIDACEQSRTSPSRESPCGWGAL